MSTMATLAPAMTSVVVIRGGASEIGNCESAGNFNRATDSPKLSSDELTRHKMVR